MSSSRSAPRILGIAVSDIVKIKQRAAELSRRGKKIVDLSIGEPDFATPDHILEAAAAAMARGETHYSGPTGTQALRAAIVRKMARENAVSIDESSVFVGCGAKQVIANALLATLSPGDEVIIPAPYWSNYVDMVRLAEGTPRILPYDPEAGSALASRLERAITARTRWIILNSPSNPTGATFDRAELTALAAMLERYPHVMIIEDAIYEHLIYDEHRYLSLLNIHLDLAERLLWANGVSKAYAMTGWRIGYGVGPRWLIDSMAVVSAQTTSHPCTIAQAAAIAALDGDQTATANFRYSFRRRRDLAHQGMNSIDGFKVTKPRGAFYLFVDAQDFLRSRGDPTSAGDRWLVEHLLTEAGVALVPGASFGAPNHFRLSYAAPEEQLVSAAESIRQLLKRS